MIRRFACVNHPTYRWSQIDNGPGAISRYSGLVFDGEEGGKPGSPFNQTEKQLREAGQAVYDHYCEIYTPECDCPATDLILLDVVAEMADE